MQLQKKKPPSSCQNDSDFDKTHNLVAARSKCEHLRFTPTDAKQGHPFYLEFNHPSYEYGVSKTVYFPEFACCLFDDDLVFLWK